MSQASFRKQQREKARRERAAAKFAKRTEKASEPAPEPAPPSRSQEAVLADLADLHAMFEDGKVTFDDFEDKKQQLTDELDVR